VQKFGGEEGLTKPTNPEDVIKTPIGLDEPCRIDTCVTSLIEKNTNVIRNTHLTVPDEDLVKLPLAKSRKMIKKGKLARVTEKLYNLEPYGLPEKPLNIDLDLYQMEDY